MQNAIHIDKTAEVREIAARLARIGKEMDQVIAETDAMIKAIDEQCEQLEKEKKAMRDYLNSDEYDRRGHLLDEKQRIKQEYDLRD